MSTTLHTRSLTSRHISRSIIITRSSQRPLFLNDPRFAGNGWPTPAMLVYEKVVSISFSHFYWLQNSDKRQVLLEAVSRELYTEGGGKIYKRHSQDTRSLIKLDLEEFQRIITKRLLNNRYKTIIPGTEVIFHHNFSSFTKGEKIMVSTPSSMTYDGIFHFDSVINNEYCFVKFESRNDIISWPKRLLHHIDLNDVSDMRVTRQMSKRRRLDMIRESNDRNESSTERNATANDEPEVIVLSDSSNDEEDNTSNIPTAEIVTDVPAPGMGVARARSTSQNDNDADDNDGEWEQIPGGMSYDNLIDTLGTGDENRSRLDSRWLTRQGFVRLKEEGLCVICREPLNKDEVVYDIKCRGSLIHPMHKECASANIEHGRTDCPTCRFDWMEL